VWVDASDARVLGTYNAGAPRTSRAITDNLYAIHTGQIGLLFGRLIVLGIGLCLLSLIALGLPLWWKRRASRARD
jgi:uncharacterized iron-regulated membrane protein